jgi:hypothetical protein
MLLRHRNGYGAGAEGETVLGEEKDMKVSRRRERRKIKKSKEEKEEKNKKMSRRRKRRKN